MNNKSILESILEFKELLQRELEKYDCNFEFIEIPKINIVKTGIMFKTDNSNMKPLIYLENFYDDYLNKTPIHIIANEIINLSKLPKPNLEFNDFDFDSLKDNILPTMINIKKNESIISKSPYKNLSE